jgi:putative ABC transport system substrate-binding protein
MRRREFIAGIAATGAVNVSISAWTQTDARKRGMKRIAIVHPTDRPEDMTIDGPRRLFRAYFEELRRLGYIEGQNLLVERYSALGRGDRYADLAREVVETRPDLIFATLGPIALQFKLATTDIPIVALSGDPVVYGLVSNLARPDGNITGVSVDAGMGVWSKRVQLLSDAARKRLLKPYFLAAPSTTMEFWQSPKLREAREQAGFHIVPALLGGRVDPAAYEQAFDAMKTDGADGLVVSDNGEHSANRMLIVKLAARHSIPAIYPYREFAEVGGLMAYGVDLADASRHIAGMTDQILRGAKPGDIPFQQQTKFELFLNRKAAALLTLEFPPSLLATADEVID